jgi:hypothetical protein
MEYHLLEECVYIIEDCLQHFRSVCPRRPSVSSEDKKERRRNVSLVHSPNLKLTLGARQNRLEEPRYRSRLFLRHGAVGQRATHSRVARISFEVPAAC